ncbi:topoisomerase IA-like protein [Saccharothrix ecbatanensis]|uniref:Topoisomerase IA-like protein n=1 Tax=Saccharothrix ecbatanensis TaxID=1105145 RepID=A0A7W9M257_9PSEU|nr:hypothetical protein [Saccharothrix ecbatanensis]MBB5804659.1 topoisomerase IA-like protein [Saccharothrix ecbatanensis]
MKLLMKRNYGVTVEAKPWLPKGEVIDTDEMGISHAEAVSLIANNRAELAPGYQADQLFDGSNKETATVKTPEKRTRRKKVNE